MGRAGRPNGQGGSGMRAAAPTDSPWGNELQDVEEIGPGAYRVGTPSHGGIMISREVGDEILSEEAKRVGAGFGHSPASPWSHDWYVFEEDADWVAAASDLEAAFEINMDRSGSLHRGAKPMPASELKPGYVLVGDDGEDATVEDVTKLPSGDIEVALQWGRGDQIGGGRKVLDPEDQMRVERLQVPE